MKSLITLSVLVLTGCVGALTPPDSAVTHPANPQAASSPVPPPQPGLLDITNAVMVKPVTEPAHEHHHEHEEHDTKPKTEEKK